MDRDPGHAPRRLGQGPGYFWRLPGVTSSDRARVRRLGQGLGYFWKNSLAEALLGRGLIYATWTRLPRVTSSDRGRGLGLGASDKGLGLGLDREKLYKGLELLVISSTYYLRHCHQLAARATKDIRHVLGTTFQSTSIMLHCGASAALYVAGPDGR